MSKRNRMVFLLSLSLGVYLLYRKSSTIPLSDPLLTESTPNSDGHRPKQYQIALPLFTPSLSRQPHKSPKSHILNDSDGMLYVKSSVPCHPISELIERAEIDWQSKLDRQSRTLEGAVKEYQRRYKRAPPKGFDEWWNYAKAHNIQLPDEYDQIHHDLEPYQALHSDYLISSARELAQTLANAYTIGKTAPSSIVALLNHTIPAARYDYLIEGADLVLDLLSDVEHLLPEFELVISTDDRPIGIEDFGVMTTLRDAAKANLYVNPEDLPRPAAKGWLSACGPNSPAVQLIGKDRKINLNDPPFGSPFDIANATFIYDHDRLMNPCMHPELFYKHGQFVSHGEGPSPGRYPTPVFSYCSTKIHHDIRFPYPYLWIDSSNSPVTNWEEKIDERLLWRGSSTGIFASRGMHWQDSHRNRLVELTSSINGTMSVILPFHAGTKDEWNVKSVKKSRLNPSLFDVAFAGGPTNCNNEDGSCSEMENIYEWRRWMQEDEESRYKFILDVDGNGWSGRFKRLMSSGSVVFKSTIYPEWYSDRIQPWVHYVPVQVNLQDLHSSLLFFHGSSLDGNGSHDDIAKKIAMQGREWSAKFWRREDMVAYFFRLILEYKRLMSDDRDGMSFRYGST